ncbi:flavin reductase family protein [Nocardioides aurantiacus]|uniref:Flavin reductase (DIM6/NTAB) family NADH-FMN oxidoreductase RutF n=1 Tax=Nocardioides aurantiacus TaxID=86796 RepID=A0A3N2CSS4_9ACTN|nr:flavin reductase family protein [Nocardioides aurantiacus]ROR90466.1 flavin reductase (DIM6/NTAB) family NADH-FMN oxidoreductase RutF [Nocardioides aurantiacus]
MTIHTAHPFADPDPDPVRRLRGRLGGAVTLWTAGDLDGTHAGLTVSSVMVGRGEPGHVLGLVDPDSDFRDVVGATGRAVVHLLQWRHRDLAEAFAGLLPSPGGPFRAAGWEPGSHGPVLLPATSHALVEVVDVREVGWSDLIDARVVDVVLHEDLDPLEHRRGRYARPAGR